MTDKNDNQEPVAVENEQNHADDSVVRGRRALLRTAVVTMPMILTLQSGAALARSSNLISASRPRSAKDPEGRMLCMDYQSVDMVIDSDDDSSGGYRRTYGSVADLGAPPSANISAIRRGVYYDEPGGERIYRRRICRDGGVYSVQKASGEWVQTRYVPQGMLVSFVGVGSFANIHITEI